MLFIGDGSHISKRDTSIIVIHYNVIDQYTRDTANHTRATSIAKFAETKSARFSSTAKIMKLDDKIAIALVSPLHGNEYLYPVSYSGVIIIVFLLFIYIPIWKMYEISSF